MWPLYGARHQPLLVGSWARGYPARFLDRSRPVVRNRRTHRNSPMVALIRKPLHSHALCEKSYWGAFVMARPGRPGCRIERGAWRCLSFGSQISWLSRDIRIALGSGYRKAPPISETNAIHLSVLCCLKTTIRYLASLLRPHYRDRRLISRPLRTARAYCAEPGVILGMRIGSR